MGTRSYLVFAAVIVAAIALGTGCRNRSRAGGPRGGDSGTIRTDAGPGTDSGGIILPDSGPPRDSGGIVVRDTGGPDPECVSNSDCLSSEMCSGGFCVPRMTMTCTTDMPLPRTIAPYSGFAPCSSATTTCIESCTDSACAQSCIDSDPDPNCGRCVTMNQISCVNSMGCQTQWTAVACCVNTTCPTDPELGCLSTTCADEDDTWATCADGAVAGCGTAIDACFM